MRIPTSEITPPGFYARRRELLAAAGLGLAGAAVGAVAACTRRATAGAGTAQVLPGVRKGPFATSEKQTSWKDVTTYNNFYEFGTDKSDPAARAHTLRTRPWTVTVDGEVKKPQTLDVDAILKLFPLEERIYRLRCVEGWSMVIPWVGFPLGPLLGRFEPTGSAKYVAFTTLHAPEQMPGQKASVLAWPYTEGLRMDEATHPLTILAVGLYGQAIPNQNGAPLRLVVPWKYGFKSIKSVVKLRLVDKQPPTSWNLSAPREYGFYSNVNPAVDHPRWSQSRERRIGEWGRRATLPFNGYAAEVASLYTGMDLAANF